MSNLPATLPAVRQHNGSDGSLTFEIDEADLIRMSDKELRAIRRRLYRAAAGIKGVELWAEEWRDHERRVVVLRFFVRP